MRIAAFISHPIQYVTPLWQELSSRTGVELCVFYFSKHAVAASFDKDFGVSFAWDIDLLAGHRYEFLPRQWPTRDEVDYTPRALNKGIVEVLHRGWDVVFVSGYAHWNNWLIAGVCASLGIPVLCWGDTNLRSDNGKPRPKLLAKRVILRTFLRAVTAVLATGGQTREYFASYGVKRESVFVCPYGVDIARFRNGAEDAGAPERRRLLRERLGIGHGQRVVMFCGKLAPWKRPLDVLDAVELLGRSDVLAVFVGDGELRNAIEERHSPHAVLAGFVNQAEMPLALSLADVLVLPSSREPYGMVVSEAQCLGVPAVVSDACGCYGPDSVLADGVSGFVYPTGDVQALAQALGKLLDQAQLHARMSQAARLQGETQSKVRAADGFLAAVAYAMQTKRTRVGVHPADR